MANLDRVPENQQFAEMVCISKEKWASIQKELAWLRCLRIAGVDNWEGYSYAFDVMDEYYPEYKEDDDEK